MSEQPAEYSGVNLKDAVIALKTVQQSYQELRRRYYDDRLKALLAVRAAVATGGPFDAADMVALVNILYWTTTFTSSKVAEICGLSVKDIRPMIRHRECFHGCVSCGEKVFVTSRSALVSAKERCARCKELEKQAQQVNRVVASEKWERVIAERKAETDRLRKMPYKDYLRTDHWKQTRENAIKRSGNACKLCNKRTELQVHHRTYIRRGCELDGDLIVLCATCHHHFHVLDGKAKPRNDAPEFSGLPF